MKEIDAAGNKKGVEFIIVEGFVLAACPELKQLFDVFLFLDCPKELSKKRRLARDELPDHDVMRYEIKDLEGYFEEYVWPCHLQYFEKYVKNDENIVQMKVPDEKLLEKALKIVKKKIKE